jgi:hypothetical protein
MKKAYFLTAAWLALALITPPAALAQGFSTSSDAGLLAGQLDVPLHKRKWAQPA